MAALLRIMVGPAETLDEKFPQSLFGSCEVFIGVHAPENVVAGNFAIESCDETDEPVFADDSVNLGIEKIHDSQEYTREGGEGGFGTRLYWRLWFIRRVTFVTSLRGASRTEAARKRLVNPGITSRRPLSMPS